ncbi:transposase [Dictyobacter sp. S3.2.2.5]|uniref:Transposase n=1 Tax=Dictyobacter halimunensis TaxID=3026934 RepID=A0ABQ6FP97_9CHLR|nr:transposase [Dictyobacter sp. S3.2.2.5]
MVLIHQVNLTEEERKQLHDLLKVGEHPARTIVRGYILLLAHQGKSDDDIAQTLEVGRATVQRVRKRYCQKGLAYALNELPRPGAKPRLDGRQEAYLIALACSDAPEGRTCWTLQLLANKLVELHIVEEISDETVRRVLKKTTSSPGSKKSGAFPR